MRVEVTTVVTHDDGRALWHFSHVEDLRPREGETLGAAFTRCRSKVLSLLKEATDRITEQTDDDLSTVATVERLQAEAKSEAGQGGGASSTAGG